MRIFPVYYLVLVVAALMGVPAVRQSLIWQLTYTSNYYLALRGSWAGPPVDHLWSLAVEEQFYLAWPALVLFLPSRWLSPTFLGAFCFAPLWRLAVVCINGSAVAATVTTFSCLDCLSAGALLALAAHVEPQSRIFL